MKRSERNFLYLNTLVIFLFILFFSIVLFLTCKLELVQKYYLIYISILITIALLGSYYISKLILSKVFKKNQFLDMMLKDTLHELNIPLSVIKANLQMLSLNEKDPKKVKKYKRIDLACEDLYKLYQDVDYYIKREIKREIREKFKVCDAIAEEIDKFKEPYPDVKINLKDNDLTIYCDKRGFSKAVGNLVSNALKYNKNNNDIDIYIDGTNLVIQDHGIGMSEAELFMVFDRYYQGNSSKQGFGIGLSIVKAFCDENKIFIHIESKQNEGTKVSLDLKNVL